MPCHQSPPTPPCPPGSPRSLARPPCRRVVQQQKALVVLLVDLLDASGSILGRVRDLVGEFQQREGSQAGCMPACEGFAAACCASQGCPSDFLVC